MNRKIKTTAIFTALFLMGTVIGVSSYEGGSQSVNIQDTFSESNLSEEKVYVDIDEYYESMLKKTGLDGRELRTASKTIVSFDKEDKSICCAGYNNEVGSCEVYVALSDPNTELKLIKDGKEISPSAVNIGDRISFNYFVITPSIPGGAEFTNMVIVQSDEDEYYENVIKNIDEKYEQLSTDSGIIKSIERNSENQLVCCLDNDVKIKFDNNVRLLKAGKEILTDELNIGYTLSYNYNQIMSDGYTDGTAIVIAHNIIKPSQYTPTPVPTPTVIPSFSPKPPISMPPLTTPPTPELVKGDYDYDGKVTLDDATIALKVALNITKMDYAAELDLDNNNKLDLQDAVIVLNIALGIQK